MEMDFSSLRRKGKSVWAEGTCAAAQTASQKSSLCPGRNELFRKAEKVRKIKTWWKAYICPSKFNFHPSLSCSMPCKVDRLTQMAPFPQTGCWVESMKNTGRQPKKWEKLQFWGLGTYCPNSVSIIGTVAASITKGHCSIQAALSLPYGLITAPVPHLFSPRMVKYPTVTSPLYLLSLCFPYILPTPL